MIQGSSGHWNRLADTLVGVWHTIINGQGKEGSKVRFREHSQHWCCFTELRHFIRKLREREERAGEPQRMGQELSRGDEPMECSEAGWQVNMSSSQSVR